MTSEPRGHTARMPSQAPGRDQPFGRVRRSAPDAAPAATEPARQTSAQASKIEKVFQGEFKVSNERDCIMTTILGSCIAACVFDPVAGVGGMNHYLLPGEEKKGDGNLRYGVNSMELLLNSMIKMGARHENMHAKVFGGAKMYDGGREIGAKNAAFAKWFLENEGIPVEMSCVGGQLGRKVRFWPVGGRAQRAFMEDARKVIVPTVAPKPVIKPEDPGDVELF